MQEFVSVKQFTDYLKKEYVGRIAYRYLQNGIVQEVSYEEFLSKVDGVAAFLCENNIIRKPIAIIGKTSYEWVSMYLGVLSSNNIVVVMDPNLLLEQKESILNQVKVEYVFADEQYIEQKNDILEHCKSVKKVVQLSAFVRDRKESDSVPQIAVNPEELGQYMFTSGTTGQGKAVMLSYRNITSTVGVQNQEPILDYDVTLSVLPIHHCFELSTTHLSLLAKGGTICINDRMEHMMENIRRFQPTVLFVVPAIGELILQNFKEQGSKAEKGRLRMIAVGGAKMRKELPGEFASYGIQIVYGFGMTECCGHMVMNMHTLDRPDSVGTSSVSHLQIRINRDGEVLLKGISTMMGYYNIDNSECFTEDGFLRTGDLGWLDEDGNLYITGRKKNVIILNNGENVYPEELEVYLAAMSGVRQAVVFEWKEQIAAMIFPEGKKDMESIELQIQALNRKIATYKRITKVFYRETPFPSTSSGKIKREEFLQGIQEAPEDEYVPPVTGMETRIAANVEQVLATGKKAGREDDFFTLGGNSISVLMLAAKLNVNAQCIYENPVIKDLAKAVQEKEQDTEQDESYINEMLQRQKGIVSTQAVRNLLLTGATGFLGVHLLHELMQQDVHKVICLVRNKEKMRKVYRRYFKAELPEKVELLVGDITKEKLGLEVNVYQNLLNWIDTVIHAAANVHHVGKREEFMQTNYLGTEHIITLCQQSDADLHFISSYVSSGIGVVPIKEDVKQFHEHMLYIGQEYKQNVYVHTKYLSEVKIIEERERGLRANIYRVGSLTSRRKDGIFQINKTDNGLRNRLKGLLKTGVYTEEMEEFPVDLTPVDDCAEAIVRLVCSGQMNHIYHMFNPNTVQLKDIGKICKKELNQVTRATFQKMVNDRLSDKEISEYVFYNALSCSSKAIKMECGETVSELENMAFRWNPNPEEYIRKFIMEN